MKNKKTILIIVGVSLLIAITIGLTYAYWQITKTQEGVNEITAACLDISLVDAESGNTGVSLLEQYPLSDTEGEALKPYKFTVTNNCDTAVDYQIALESIGDSNTSISQGAIKVMLDSNAATLLSSNETVATTIAGAYASHKLGIGTLAKSGDEGSSATHELRLWINETAPVEENNKSYNGKITVTIGQGIELEKTLGETILAQYGGLSKITELTDFSTATTGLYKAEDYLGTSYYFRGAVENNYVKFGTYADNLSEIVTSYLGCPMDTDDEGNEDYICNEEYSYATEDECNTAMEQITGDFECRKAESGTNSIYKTGDPIYWRIVRINGDGTIRLVYYGPTIDKNDENYKTTIDAGMVRLGDQIDGISDTYNSTNGFKIGVDTWYSKHLNTNYKNYIADSDFCNDTSVNKDEESNIYYNSYNRLFENVVPTLKCNDTYKYTVANGKLTYPVGLLTADEAAFAGLLNNSDTNNYLVGESSWTMTPLFESQDGELEYGKIGTELSSAGSGLDEVANILRPVINLKADVRFTKDSNGIYVITTN